MIHLHVSETFQSFSQWERITFSLLFVSCELMGSFFMMIVRASKLASAPSKKKPISKDSFSTHARKYEQTKETIGNIWRRLIFWIQRHVVDLWRCSWEIRESELDVSYFDPCILILRVILHYLLRHSWSSFTPRMESKSDTSSVWFNTSCNLWEKRVCYPLSDIAIGRFIAVLYAQSMRMEFLSSSKGVGSPLETFFLEFHGSFDWKFQTSSNSEQTPLTIVSNSQKAKPSITPNIQNRTPNTNGRLHSCVTRDVSIIRHLTTYQS